jgi:hypothetical protein
VADDGDGEDADDGDAAKLLRARDAGHQLAACAAQFRNIHREGQHIGGEGRAKDDLVIAAGLAVIGWNDWIKGELEMENRTYAYDMRPKGESRTMNSAERVVSKFFRMNGIRTSNGDQ